MSLNPKYMIAPSVQEFFIDTASGLPLSAGLVYFYSDNNRAQLKPIYTLNGSAPNYGYVQLNNPVTLSGVGTFQDNSGNDCLPYYYPYDSNGDVELYYIAVYNSNGVLQFTRQAYPNFVQGGDGLIEPLNNYIPNGQFLSHNQPPANPLTGLALGQIPSTQPITYVAQGGWTFERPNSSTATDIVTFTQISVTETPPSNPRYKINITNQVAGSDSFKYLAVYFPNVFKFNAFQQTLYTLGFSAITNNNTNQDIDIQLYFNFGTGGSSPLPPATIETVTITPTFSDYTVQVDFGNLTGNNIGPNNDDYVQIIFSLPSTVSMSFTDVYLVMGQPSTVATFPITTDAQMLDESIAGWVPTPAQDGSDLYLPMVMTPVGAKFDKSVVGEITILGSNSSNIKPGNVLCDGTTYYTFGYDATVDSVTGVSTGIPFSRLQSNLFNASLGGGMPIHGTGYDYSTAYLTSVDSSVTNGFYIYTNSPFNVTPAADTGGTTFTFANLAVGNSGGYGVSVAPVSNHLIVIGNTGGAVLDNIGLYNNISGFSSNQFKGASGSVGGEYALGHTVMGTVAASHYFSFSTTTNKYYIWYKVDGAGSDPGAPAGGYSPIQVNVFSTMTSLGVANITSLAMNGFTVDRVTTVAGSAIPQSSYFTFNSYSASASQQNKYVVWFNKNGAGTQPVVAGTTLYIQVPITGTETAAQIAQKVIYQTISNNIYGINVQYFGTPDLRGKFVRGVSSGTGFDIDAASRYGLPNMPLLQGDLVGTIEYDDMVYHNHSATTSMAATGGAAGNMSGTFVATDAATGAGLLIPYLSGGGSTSTQSLASMSAPSSSFTTTIGAPTNIYVGNENRPVNMEFWYQIHL